MGETEVSVHISSNSDPVKGSDDQPNNSWYIRYIPNCYSCHECPFPLHNIYHDQLKPQWTLPDWPWNIAVWSIWWEAELSVRIVHADLINIFENDSTDDQTQCSLFRHFDRIFVWWIRRITRYPLSKQCRNCIKVSNVLKCVDLINVQVGIIMW